MIVAPDELLWRTDMPVTRKLAWEEDSQKWTCSECAWVFEPHALFGDQSLNKYFDVVRRDEEFTAHLCADYKKEDGIA